MKGKPITPWAEQVTDAIGLLQMLVGSGDIGLDRSSRQMNIMDDKDFQWAIIRATGTITARSGATPGVGPATIQKYNATSNLLADTNRTLPAVYNIFDSTLATDDYTFGVRFLGKWWNLPIPGSGSGGGTGTYDHCACPETHYVVTTNCGPCPTAPRFWWLDITAATLHSGMMECGGRDCADLAGTQFRMANNDTATDAGCTWETKANGCVTAELTWDAANTRWKLTLADIDDCVMGIWYADEADFDCCGTANSTWTADEANVCDLTFTVSKDDCTCCPPNPITCLPDTGVLCTSFNACCINDESACTLNVTVVGCDDSDALGIPPDVVPDDCKCANLNGGYAMEWVGDCTWVAFTHVADGGGTSHVSRATLTLSGTTWTMTIMGKSGEIAVFRGEWDCGPTINMDYVEDESTCSCIGRLPNFGYGTCTSASFTLGYI